MSRNWTPKQKKAHAVKMKAVWAKRREEKESLRQMVIAIDDQEDALRGWALSQTGITSVMRGAEPDMVNRPPHYTFGKYEVIDVLMDWFPSEPLLWNAVKYLARWDKKGDPIENLEKAVFYIQKKIDVLKGGGK